MNEKAKDPAKRSQPLLFLYVCCRHIFIAVNVCVYMYMIDKAFFQWIKVLCSPVPFLYPQALNDAIYFPPPPLQHTCLLAHSITDYDTSVHLSKQVLPPSSSSPQFDDNTQRNTTDPANTRQSPTSPNT